MKAGSHRSMRWWLGVLSASLVPVVGLAAGCAHMFRPAPSSTSTEGVQLTVRDYECSQGDITDSQKGADLVVDMEIRNQSSLPLVVRTGAMQVLDTEGGSMTRRGWNQTSPVQVEAGRKQSFVMHFLGSSKHCCSSRLSLAPSGVTLGDRTLAMVPVNFVPPCTF